MYVSVGNRAVRLYKLPYNKLEKKKREKGGKSNVKKRYFSSSFFEPLLGKKFSISFFDKLGKVLKNWEKGKSYWNFRRKKSYSPIFSLFRS